MTPSGEAVRGPWPLWRHWLAVAVFAAASLLAVGYGFGSEDSANYIPLVWARLEPGLYAGDTAFGWILESSWSHHASFFAVTTSLLARLLSMEGAFFLLHAASLFLLLWAWWLIGRAVGGPATGYLTLLLLSTSRLIGGTQIDSLPHEFQPRVLASALAFLAVAALANGLRTRTAAGLGGLALLFHPISALMALPAAALAPLLRQAPWRTRLREWGLAAALIAAPFILWQLAQRGPVTDVAMTGHVSQQWQAILDFRLQGQALNVGSWSPTEWLLVGIPLLLWFMGLQRREALSEADRVLGLVMLSAIALATFGSVAADVFRSSMASQMMLSRLVYVPLVVGTAYGAWWLLDRWREGGLIARAWLLIVGSALAQGGMALALLALLPILLLDRVAHDRWLVFGGRVLALGWLGTAVAIAFRSRLGLLAPEMAAPDLLIFAEPPLINVLLVATLALALLGLARPARLLAAILVPVIALTPVWLHLATHRHLSPNVAIQRLAASVQAPWRAPESDWAALAYWARSHTPVGSRFLTPMYRHGFRAMAKRPIVTDWKDGGLTLFSPALAERWLAIFQEVDGYERRPATEVAALAIAHGCRYVVMPVDRPLIGESVFTAGRFSVYQLPAEDGRHAP